MPHLIKPFFVIVSVICILLSSCSDRTSVKTVKDLDNDRTWGIYRGDQRLNQFSSLEQINRENVEGLEVAWT